MNKPADLAQDGKDLKEVLGHNPEDALRNIEIPKEEKSKEELDEEAFYASLNPAQQADFDRLAPYKEHFPEGYDIAMAVKDKGIYGSIYILPLPSSTFIYRPLSLNEDTKIKTIQNMTQEEYRKHVVVKCLVYPAIDLANFPNWLAGTLVTLYDNILIASDFSTMETVPIKM